MIFVQTVTLSQNLSPHRDKLYPTSGKKAFSWEPLTFFCQASDLGGLAGHRGPLESERSFAMKVVIIGGVAGGATAAARLRRLDETAEIVVLERTGYVSYRCV